jgi:hypothetical protein
MLQPCRSSGAGIDTDQMRIPLGSMNCAGVGGRHKPAQERGSDGRAGFLLRRFRELIPCRRMHENLSFRLSQRGIEAIPRQFNQAIEAFLLEWAQHNHVWHSVTISYQITVRT